MAGSKEIRKKIKSVKSTQKITRAMEMVAASKMRKTQERMLAARPYSELIYDVIGNIAASKLDYQNAFFNEREERQAGFIIISTDKGLCGGLNVNLFKKVIDNFAEKNAKNTSLKVCVLGLKGILFFHRLKGVDIVAETKNLGEKPNAVDLIGVIKIMLDYFVEEKIDRLYIAYNKFINTMVQTPTITQLLPLKAKERSEKYNLEYIYEPNAAQILDLLIKRYIESQVYQAAVENAASEQAAKMVAVKSASDNASNIIDELQLEYNRARQAAITQELSEIVAGAAAV